MAQKLDLNVLLIAGAAVGVLYFWNQIKGQKSNIIVAKTDLVEARGDIVETRQEEMTERTKTRQENRTERVKIIVNKVFGKDKDAAVKKDKKSVRPVPSYANGMLTFSGSANGFSVAPEKAKALLLQKTATETSSTYSNLKSTPYNIKGVAVY